MVKTLPISKVREELPSLVDNANKLLDEYIITVNGSPAAVLMSVQEYESWKETIEIMSDPELIKAIKAGEDDLKNDKLYDWDEVKKDLKLDVHP